MKYLIKITCVNEELFFLTNNKKVKDYLLLDEEFVPETIPGYKAEEMDVNTISDLIDKPTVYYKDSMIKNVAIDVENNKIFLSIPYKELYVRDIVYYILCMYARILNKKNKYFVHTAIVEKDGKATMLIGEAGAGKTSLALYLCTKYGYNFVCNDRAVVSVENNEVVAIASTLQTHIRVGVINELFPEFKHHLNDKIMKKPWKNKIYINPEMQDLGIKIVNNVPIENIYFISTYDTEDKNSYFEMYDDDYDKLLATMQYFSEYIRADRNIILSLTYPFKCLDDVELSKVRMNDVEKIIQRVNIADVRGSVKGVAKIINEKQK